MNVWSKMLTALRGGANEVGEAVVDSQALRILDQEIRDADTELRRSKEALAEIMAKHKLASDKVTKSAASIAEYEQYALKALDAGNETLAKEVAEKIANLEIEQAGEREQAARGERAADPSQHASQRRTARHREDEQEGQHLEQARHALRRACAAHHRQRTRRGQRHGRHPTSSTNRGRWRAEKSQNRCRHAARPGAQAGKARSPKR